MKAMISLLLAMSLSACSLGVICPMAKPVYPVSDTVSEVARRGKAIKSEVTAGRLALIERMLWATSVVGLVTLWLTARVVEDSVNTVAAIGRTCQAP